MRHKGHMAGAFRKGESARLRGVPRDANPYLRDPPWTMRGWPSVFAGGWRDGWNTADREMTAEEKAIAASIQEFGSDTRP